MNISLPDSMIEFIEEQVRAGAHTSASEYIGELIRSDQKSKVKEGLEQAVLAAHNERQGIATGRDWWESLRTEFIKRIKTRKPLAGA